MIKWIKNLFNKEKPKQDTSNHYPPFNGWTDRERGPECYCGMPTTVMFFGPHEPVLVCLFHSYESGSSWELNFPRPEGFESMDWDTLAEIGDKHSND